MGRQGLHRVALFCRNFRGSRPGTETNRSNQRMKNQHIKKARRAVARKRLAAGSHKLEFKAECGAWICRKITSERDAFIDMFVAKCKDMSNGETRDWRVRPVGIAASKLEVLSSEQLGHLVGGAV